MRWGRVGSLQFGQVVRPVFSIRLLPAKRRMLRRDRETFFLGTAMSRLPATCLLNSFLQRRERAGFLDLGAGTAPQILVGPALRADSFAVLPAERLEWNQELKLFRQDL